MDQVAATLSHPNPVFIPSRIHHLDPSDLYIPTPNTHLHRLAITRDLLRQIAACYFPPFPNHHSTGPTPRFRSPMIVKPCARFPDWADAHAALQRLRFDPGIVSASRRYDLPLSALVELDPAQPMSMGLESRWIGGRPAGFVRDRANCLARGRYARVGVQVRNDVGPGMRGFGGQVASLVDAMAVLAAWREMGGRPFERTGLSQRVVGRDLKMWRDWVGRLRGELVRVWEGGVRFDGVLTEEQFREVEYLHRGR